MEHYDVLESRSREEREANLFARLRSQIAHAMAKAPAVAEMLRGVDPDTVGGRDDLARLPLLRKSDLIDRQRAAPPFGGLVATPIPALARVFQSPGPIYEPQGRGQDYWRIARAMFAAGMRRGDLLFNTFAYHFTPAGSMFETGADALGCAVFPAGVGQTEAQIATIAALRPRGYTGTPSFLNIILEKAREIDADVRSLEVGLVSGEALPGSLRERFADQGMAVNQCYATADVGLIAYESPAREGMVVDEDVIVEIVRPGTGDPVAEGEVGEVVVTTLNPDYPLIRFATGDLSAVMSGPSPCGRTNLRIKGWMGRADQTTKIRGMFVHPTQVAEVVRRHGDIAQARVVVTRVDERDVMRFDCESTDRTDAHRATIEETVREVCKVRGEVRFVDSADLPNDGKVIDDQRSYD